MATLSWIILSWNWPRIPPQPTPFCRTASMQNRVNTSCVCWNLSPSGRSALNNAATPHNSNSRPTFAASFSSKRSRGMNPSTHSADLFIVGGGPAGLATAILAAKRGLHVAVADHNVFPIDKACGEGLMPDTLTALETLGIDLCRREAIPFRGIRFREAESANCIEAEFGESFGLGIRRTVLHAKLAERAAEVGVVLLWGNRVTLNDDGRILCQGEPVCSTWVIGADGEASPFRKWAVLDEARPEHIRFAASQHFQVTPWTD